MNFGDLSHTAQQNGRTVGFLPQNLLLTVPHVLAVSRTVRGFLGKTSQPITTGRSWGFLTAIVTYAKCGPEKAPSLSGLSSLLPQLPSPGFPLCTSVFWETLTLLGGS